MAGNAEFSRAKIKELVLYLGERSAADEGYGMVKLNKLLYRADSEAFRLHGRSITGSEYLKQELGPVARGLQGILEEMARDKLIVWRHYPAGPYQRDVPEPQFRPDLARVGFTVDEIAVVEAALKELAPHGGKSVSDWSHEEWAGWRITELGAPIPYETAIIASEPGPKKTVARLRERILSGNWD